MNVYFVKVDGNIGGWFFNRLMVVFEVMYIVRDVVSMSFDLCCLYVVFDGRGMGIIICYCLNFD